MKGVKLIISPRYQSFKALTFAIWRIMIKNGSNDNHYYLGETIFYTTMVRLSKQREAILRVLKSTTSHPTADWVYEQVRKEMPRISLGTVYRNLRLLAQEGGILQLDFAGTPSRFDANTQPHSHFLCERCGCIFDVEEPVPKGIAEKVALETGLKILNHRLEFSGICKDCQSEISQGKLL